MKLTKKDAKELIFAMGFLPEDGSNDIYTGYNSGTQSLRNGSGRYPSPVL